MDNTAIKAALQHSAMVTIGSIALVRKQYVSLIFFLDNYVNDQPTREQYGYSIAQAQIKAVDAISSSAVVQLEANLVALDPNDLNFATGATTCQNEITGLYQQIDAIDDQYLVLFAGVRDYLAQVQKYIG